VNYSNQKCSICAYSSCDTKLWYIDIDKNLHRQHNPQTNAHYLCRCCGTWHEESPALCFNTFLRYLASPLKHQRPAMFFPLTSWMRCKMQSSSTLLKSWGRLGLGMRKRAHIACTWCAAPLSRLMWSQPAFELQVKGCDSKVVKPAWRSARVLSCKLPLCKTASYLCAKRQAIFVQNGKLKSYLCAKRQATFVQATFVQNGTPQLLFYTPYCTPHKPYIFEVQKQCTGWWLIVSDVSILSFALPIQGKRRSLPSAQHRPTVRHRTGSFPWSSNNPCIIWWVHHRIQNSNRILSLVFKWPLHYMLNSPVCAPFLKLHAFFINCFGGLPYQQAPLSLIDVDSCFHCLFSFLTAPKCLFLPYWRWGWFHCLLSFFDGSKMPLSPQLMWGVILPAWFFNGTTMFCSLMIWGLVPLPALRGQWNHCSVTAN